MPTGITWGYREGQMPLQYFYRLRLYFWLQSWIRANNKIKLWANNKIKLRANNKIKLRAKNKINLQANNKIKSYQNDYLGGVKTEKNCFFTGRWTEASEFLITMVDPPSPQCHSASNAYTYAHLLMQLKETRLSSVQTVPVTTLQPSLSIQ